MPTIPELAREALDSLTTVRKDNGPIVVTKDDAPEWVRDLVQHAHGDFFPDDWRYASIRSALEMIANSERVEELAHDFADSNVDIYTHDRLKWLASNLNRPGYCDEAAGEYGSDTGITELIGYGQYMESEEIFSLVVEALEDRAANYGLNDLD